MLHFSKAKIWMIAVVCALGVLFTLPNFISPGTLPSWVPQNRVNLGLDLQGGTSFLVQLVSEKLEDGTTREITPSMVDQAVETIRKSASTG